MGNIIGMIPPVVWKWLAIILGIIAIGTSFYVYIGNFYSMLSMAFTGKHAAVTATRSYASETIFHIAIVCGAIYILKKNQMQYTIFYPVAIYGCQMLILTTAAVILMKNLAYPISSNLPPGTFFMKFVAILFGFGIVIVGRLILNTKFVRQYYVYTP